MSTTTTNYKLVKPDLTDPADITAMNVNWDKVDDELKKRATYTYGTDELEAGVTQLETGKLHFVYE